MVQCYFLFRDIVLYDYEIRGSARVSRSRSSAYEVQPKKLTHYIVSRAKYVIKLVNAYTAKCPVVNTKMTSFPVGDY